MKVSIQQDIPHDEFAKRFGAIAGASYDEAHAALLRAQGIKPVQVETVYGEAQQAQPPALPAPIPAPTDPTDLAPLYGLFIQLGDMLTETREQANDLDSKIKSLAKHMLDHETALQRHEETLDKILGGSFTVWEPEDRKAV